MPRMSKRPKLVLTGDEEKELDELRRRARTAAVRDVQRAQILLRYHAGETVSQIARALKITRKSVLKWIDKALQMGVKAGMKDTPHKPREAVITDDAKAWVVNLACSKPKDLGYAAELWTRSALARHVRRRRQRRVFRHWSGQVRRPFSEFLRGRSCSLTKSDTTWSAAIPNSSGRCGKCCWSIAKWRCKTKLPARAVRNRM